MPFGCGDIPAAYTENKFQIKQYRLKHRREQVSFTRTVFGRIEVINISFTIYQ